MDVHFEHAISDEVVIKPSGRKGTVLGLWVGESAERKANVRWYDDGGREYESWYMENDLKKAT